MVVAMLRKEVPRGLASAPPWLSRWMKSFRRTLNAANIRASELQVAAYMAVGAAAVACLIIVGADLSGFQITLGVVQLAFAIAVVLAFLLPWMVIGRSEEHTSEL